MSVYVVDLPFVKPNCLCNRPPHLAIAFSSLVLISRSYSFPRILNKQIGLYPDA